MTSLPDRAGQLVRLMLNSDKPGEVFAAASAFNRMLTAAGLDIHQFADLVVAALAPPPNQDDNNEWIEVDSYTFAYHRKPGSKPGVRITYRCGGTVYFDFLAFGHSGVAREIACTKWEELGGAGPAPTTASEAINRFDELDCDIQIAVRLNDKTGYWDVVAQRGREVRA